MNQFEMIVAIVAVVAIARTARSLWGKPEEPGMSKRELRYRMRNNLMNAQPEANPEADRLREEVKGLKERIAVLERLATENNRAIDLDREIEKLR